MENMENYIDMVRNHKEKAFDEGMEAMWNIAYANGGTSKEFPENPYKIKEEKGGKDGNI